VMCIYCDTRLCVDTCTYTVIFKVDEAASTNFFRPHTRWFVCCMHMLVVAHCRLHQYSSSRAIASSQHHPREARPSFGQPNRYRQSKNGIWVEHAYQQKVCHTHVIIDKRRQNRKNVCVCASIFLRSAYILSSFLSVLLKCLHYYNGR
jgi:hypothetical protein